MIFLFYDIINIYLLNGVFLVKILNYNDYFRQYISTESEEKESQESLLLFERIKKNDDFSKFLAGIIYECAYISYIGQLKLYPNDSELKENLEFLQELNDIEEFIFALDKEIFDDLCEEVAYVHALEYYSKRNFISYVLEHKEFLRKAFPCYVIDLLFYLNRYDASVIIDSYYERLYNDDKNPFFNTVKSSVEELFTLEEQDFFAYKYIVLDMIEGFYKYNKFLESLGIADGNVEEIISEISKDLNFFIYYLSRDRKVLRTIIEGYIKYNIASKEDLENIDGYFEENENKKEITKILKKCNKLKKEN